MMRARHAHRSKVPFPAVLASLVLLVVGVVASTVLARDEGAAGGAGGSTRPKTAPSTSTTPTDFPGVPGATLAGTHRGVLVIHATGDVSLDPSYIPTLRSKGYGWAWSGLGGLFEHDDLTVINLEFPATTVVDPVPKEFDFRCDPAALPAAEHAGVDVANQANNHAYDQGPGGLLDSIRQIRAAGLRPIGAGWNRTEALQAAVFDLKGWKVAVLGIDEVVDPPEMVAGTDTPGTAGGHDFSLALQAVRDAAARSDLVVVMIHWGVELDTQPRDEQVEQAHRLIGAGADVIFGGHSHRLQPMAVYRGRPVFYSLGNFVWPHLSQEGSTTGIAEVRVTPRGTFRARLLPAFIISDGHPVLR
jgi:poly-gamma-glutamate capsule biosynthesis protein CapA/YwtB (metallophosphatase superfamily)